MYNKKKILVFIDWFVPGFKAGGPIRSIANFANSLQDELDIYIVTGDRDIDDTFAYPDIIIDKWIRLNNYQVYYSSPHKLSFKRVGEIIKEISPDWIYLNAMFSWRFSIIPVIVNHFNLTRLPVLLATRGMLKASALQFRNIKKTVFLSLYKLARFHKFLVFQATSADELKDISRIFGNNIQSVLLPNLPGVQKPFSPVVNKNIDTLKMIFVARIHPIKKLDFLLEMLAFVSYPVSLTIIGKIDDQNYWQRCKRLIRDLSKNITISVFNDIEHSHIEDLIIQHHLFVLPTQGENFGHSIFESLSAGRPVLISDQTPWRSLSDEHAGWDLDLQRPEKFREVIDKVSMMDNKELNTWAYGAWQYCSQFLQKLDYKDLYLYFFTGSGK